MARLQEFDQHQVLSDAMTLFWRQGYEATSITDITRVTKLQPGSLYAAYKSKRNLFLLSLDLYSTDLHASVSRLLHSSQSPLTRIHQFFSQLLKDAASDKDMKGCLLVNTLLEVPPDDEEINQRVAAMLQAVEQEFRTVLEEARTAGELSANKNPETLARTLISGIFGMRVYNRMNPGKKALKSIADNLLSMLD